VALLVIFEFLNLLLHPFLEHITHHSPLLMLLSLVCIAGFIGPLASPSGEVDDSEVSGKEQAGKIKSSKENKLNNWKKVLS